MFEFSLILKQLYRMKKGTERSIHNLKNIKSYFYAIK